MYTVHVTLCTIQTTAQYTRNKPRERTYGTNEHRFHIYYIQESLSGTVQVNTYFATAQSPVHNYCPEKESLLYDTQLKKPVNRLLISKNEMQYQARAS